MAQAVEQAQKQRELSKQALTADLDRLEVKLRHELDVKGRIRRDGVRILAIAGGAVLLIGGIIVLRSRLGGRKQRSGDEPATYADLAAELREIRNALDKQTKKQSGGGLPQKLLLRGVSAAGAAAGSMAARQMLARQTQGAAKAEENRRARAG